MVNTANFPNVGSENGIQALAAYVHGLGLKFGIYETPGISGQAVTANTPILGTSYTADDIATTQVAGQLQLRRHGCDQLQRAGRAGVHRLGRRTSSRPGAWTTSSSTASATATVPTSRAWQAAIQQSGRPMVLNITQGSYTIKLAPTLQQYANQWEFAPDIELNGPDEGSADACNNPPYTGCLSVFPLTSYATGRPTGSTASPSGSRTAAPAGSTTTTRSRSATAAPTRACPWPPRSPSSACGRSARPR